MNLDQLIEKIKRERSLSEFYNLKGEILEHLELPKLKPKKGDDK